MVAPVPNLAAATVIGAAGLGWTVGTNLFAGPVTAADPTGVPSPARACFVLASGGPERRRTFGAPFLAVPGIQIRVRWDRDDFDGGEAAARAIMDALDSSALGAGYLNFSIRESGPIYIGQNEAGLHEWTLNAGAMYQG